MMPNTHAKVDLARHAGVWGLKVGRHGEGQSEILLAGHAAAGKTVGRMPAAGLPVMPKMAWHLACCMNGLQASFWKLQAAVKLQSGEVPSLEAPIIGITHNLNSSSSMLNKK